MIICSSGIFQMSPGGKPVLPCKGLGGGVGEGREPRSLNLPHNLYKTPLVDGTPGARGSGWVAMSRARPMALKVASMM